MVRVAILGGSGHVGRTLSEVISQDSRHSVLVLGRKVPRNTLTGVRYVPVNYTDSKALVSVLENNQIHTVISCLMLTHQRTAEAEEAAINAAEASRCTRRFVASNWGPPTMEELRDRSPWYPHQLRMRERLRGTSLEWTEIATGYFLDYWGMPYIRTNLTPDMPVLDIPHGVAGVPGTGEEPVSFAYSYDVARVVAEVLEEPAWEETTYIVGDRLTWNEFIAKAEAACGRRFQVSYDDLERLERGDITELPNHRLNYDDDHFPKEQLRTMYAGLGLSMAKGTFGLDVGKSVHLKFPHLKMLTVGEMLHKTWGYSRQGEIGGGGGQQVCRADADWHMYL